MLPLVWIRSFLPSQSSYAWILSSLNPFFIKECLFVALDAFSLIVMLILSPWNAVICGSGGFGLIILSPQPYCHYDRVFSMALMSFLWANRNLYINFEG